MSASAIIFLIFAVAVLWGGLAYCLRLAMKTNRVN